MIMTKKCLPKTVLTVVFLCSLPAVMADDGISYVCKQGDKERIISVVYKQDGAKVPCEVTYEKSDSQGAKTLWSANNEAGYCETKAESFVEKQRGWGWSCE